MFKPAGIRTRMSFAAVIEAVAASVMVSALIVVLAAPTTKLWFAADEMVGATIVLVRLSVAATVPAAPAVMSTRLVAGDTALKLVNLRPETMIWLPAAKLVVT